MLARYLNLYYYRYLTVRGNLHLTRNPGIEAVPGEKNITRSDLPYTGEQCSLFIPPTVPVFRDSISAGVDLASSRGRVPAAQHATHRQTGILPTPKPLNMKSKTSAVIFNPSSRVSTAETLPSRNPAGKIRLSNRRRPTHLANLQRPTRLRRNS